MRYTFLLFLCLLIKTANSQCSPNTFDTLQVNNTFAAYSASADFWANRKYSFPAPPDTSSKARLFAGGFWVSGITPSNDLRVAGMHYRNRGFDFFPGPIDSASQSVDASHCTFYDQVFSIDRMQIVEHLDKVSLGTPLDTLNIDPDILHWPGKGNIWNSHVSQDKLAPFVDNNNNGIYEPHLGDYPCIKGEKMLFWVVNDLAAPHGLTGGPALGIEVQFSAWAVDTVGVLANTTFLEATVINKAGVDYQSVYLSLFTDGDMRDYLDDYLAVDSQRNAVVMYNAPSSFQEPMMAQVFLNQTMSSMTPAYTHSIDGLTHSDWVEVNYRNAFEGKWGDGIPFTYGDFGLLGTRIATYLYPSNPADTSTSAWSECQASLPEGHRPFYQNSGPYALPTNSSISLHTAFIGFRAKTYTECVDFTNEVYPDIDSVRAAYTQSYSSCKNYNSPTSIRTEKDLDLRLYPNPAGDKVTLETRPPIEELIVFSLTGQEIRSTISLVNKHRAIIDFSNKKPGVHCIKLNGTTTKPIVIY